MRSLTELATAHKNQVEALRPFIFLFELETNDTPARRYRVTNFDQRVNWGFDSQGFPIPYYPAPVLVGDLESTSEGDLPSIDITIGNSGPVSLMDMDGNDGYGGNEIRVIVVSSEDLDSGVPVIDQTAEVVSSSLSHEAATFTVTGGGLFRSQFPQLIYSRRTCIWSFGSAQCGYDVTASGAGFSKCGITAAGVEVARQFSLDACNAVGDDEDAQGVTRRHPQRFGGKPGMSRG